MFDSNLEKFSSFGTFFGHLVYIYHFGMVYKEKSGNPARDRCMQNTSGQGIGLAVLLK
jgi:hypothetical protein